MKKQLSLFLLTRGNRTSAKVADCTCTFISLLKIINLIKSLFPASMVLLSCNQNDTDHDIVNDLCVASVPHRLCELKTIV
jgi:hypothetical protein